MSKLVDLGEVLLPQAIRDLKKGQTLGFKQDDGSVKHYKIIRINKTKRTCWAEETRLFTEEDFKEHWEDVRNG